MTVTSEVCFFSSSFPFLIFSIFHFVFFLFSLDFLHCSSVFFPHFHFSFFLSCFQFFQSGWCLKIVCMNRVFRWSAGHRPEAIEIEADARHIELREPDNSGNSFDLGAKLAFDQHPLFPVTLHESELLIGYSTRRPRLMSEPCAAG